MLPVSLPYILFKRRARLEPASAESSPAWRQRHRLDQMFPLLVLQWSLRFLLGGRTDPPEAVRLGDGSAPSGRGTNVGRTD